MSLWPIIGIRCDNCKNYQTLGHYDLDDLDENYQQRFIDFLVNDGWGLSGRRDCDFEADDDYTIYGLCQECESKRILFAMM
jgi:hypothetical protein